MTLSTKNLFYIILLSLFFNQAVHRFSFMIMETLARPLGAFFGSLMMGFLGIFVMCCRPFSAIFVSKAEITDLTKIKIPFIFTVLDLIVWICLLSFIVYAYKKKWI